MELIRPDTNYETSYREAIQEYRAENRDIGVDFEFAEKDFSAFTAQLRQRSEGKYLPEGYVPESLFWLVDNGEYIGQVSVRHILTEHLRQIGGHIGYNIRPSKRKRGYGTEILKLVLPKTKELGIEKALVTCDVTNVGSRKIIERGGGQFESQVPNSDTGIDKLRYWIDLSSV